MTIQRGKEGRPMSHLENLKAEMREAPEGVPVADILKFRGL